MLDYLLDPTFLLTLDNINKKDVEYILSSFKIYEVKKRNDYLYKNYVKTQNKLKWLNSEKEHKEWANNNNKIKYYANILKKNI